MYSLCIEEAFNIVLKQGCELLTVRISLALIRVFMCGFRIPTIYLFLYFHLASMTSKYPAMSIQFIYRYLIVQVTLIAFALRNHRNSPNRFDAFYTSLHFNHLPQERNYPAIAALPCYPIDHRVLLFSVPFPRNKYSSTTNRLPETLAILLRILKSCLCVLLHINTSFVHES